MKSDYDVIIVGAGAAGIGAAFAAREAGLDYLLVEASHRAGGRGLTEQLSSGAPLDLGCHWLHSGSINPLAAKASQHGFQYDTTLPSREFYMHGWVGSEREADYLNYQAQEWQKIEAAADAGRDVALSELIDFESPWAPYYAHWQGLMTSHDVDSFSAMDLILYRDTNENWPVKQGYGALLAELASTLPVQFNTGVEKIDWSGSKIQLRSSRGDLSCDQLLLTVSTGVLGGGDIVFTPELPVAKREAIAALPLGCYNNYALSYEGYAFDAGTPERVDYSDGADVNFAFKLSCSGYSYVYCSIAGRAAISLEQRPHEARALITDALAELFGHDIKKRFTEFRSSAWASDPLIKGAFSASQPGCADQRPCLRSTLAEKIWFAGEACSEDSFSTAHGAWITGEQAVLEIKNAVAQTQNMLAR